MKRKCKEWDSVLILCVNVNNAIDTMLKFANANIDADAKCERTFNFKRNIHSEGFCLWNDLNKYIPEKSMDASEVSVVTLIKEPSGLI